MNRSKLPFRKNCEGYFLTKDNRILAKDTGHFIEFPGGGVDENETPEKALIREAYEETGAKIENLKKIKIIKFKWDEYWAKSEKQKARYEKFQGEEMHFFTGKVKEIKKAKGDGHDEGWKGEVAMDIKEAIAKIKEYGWTKDMDEYRSFQLKMLEGFG